MRHQPFTERFLIPYYGLLQTLHLLTLARAGFRILQGVSAPFPILPPPGGWTAQAMAFLYGLALTDIIGILLGIMFAAQWAFKKKFNPTLGFLSLAIFITGAIVFAAGTFPSGAWTAHPIAYRSMVLLFAPAPLLFIALLRAKSQPVSATRD